jgi:hypothetical protein
MFVVVRLGCCTVAAHRVCSAIREPAPFCVCSYSASLRSDPIICALMRLVLPAPAPSAVRAAPSRPYPPAGAPVRARPPSFSRWLSSSEDPRRSRYVPRGPLAPARGEWPTLRPVGTGHRCAQQRPMDPRPKDRGAVLLIRTLLLQPGLLAKLPDEERIVPLRALRPTNSKPRSLT